MILKDRNDIKWQNLLLVLWGCALIFFSKGVNAEQNNDKTSSQAISQKSVTEAPKPLEATRHKEKLWAYKRKHFNTYNLKDEMEIGRRYMNQQIGEFHDKKVPVDPVEWQPIQKRIDGIVKKLSAVSDIPQFKYEVHIFDKKDIVNAYCLPGGKIGVFTGLFDEKKGLIDLKSDDEIAAVLGHEIAHATMRHVTRRMTTYNGLGVLGSVLSAGVTQGAGDNWGYMTEQVFNVGTSLYFPSYSRKFEKEADRVGLYYMTKAGYNPQSAVEVWQRASERAKNKSKDDKTSFFDSHPASGERAKDLRGYLPDAESIKKEARLRQIIRGEIDESAPEK